MAIMIMRYCYYIIQYIVLSRSIVRQHFPMVCSFTDADVEELSFLGGSGFEKALEDLFHVVEIAKSLYKTQGGTTVMVKK